MTHRIIQSKTIRCTYSIVIIVIELIVQGKPVRLGGVPEQAVRYNRPDEPASDDSVAGFC